MGWPPNISFICAISACCASMIVCARLLGVGVGAVGEFGLGHLDGALVVTDHRLQPQRVELGALERTPACAIVASSTMPLMAIRRVRCDPSRALRRCSGVLGSSRPLSTARGTPCRVSISGSWAAEICCGQRDDRRVGRAIGHQRRHVHGLLVVRDHVGGEGNVGVVECGRRPDGHRGLVRRSGWA